VAREQAQQKGQGKPECIHGVNKTPGNQKVSVMIAALYDYRIAIKQRVDQPMFIIDAP
jgi:hypothetical protein